MDKPLYIQRAPSKSNPVARTIAFVFLFVIFCVLLFLANFVSYSGIVTLLVIAAFAICTYGLMKNMLFNITYVLYEDKLVFRRRYGKIEMEMETFYLEKAVFGEKSITYEGKNYDFYPDDKLKEFLLK